jgi:hypothetical protein
MYLSRISWRLSAGTSQQVAPVLKGGRKRQPVGTQRGEACSLHLFNGGGRRQN